MLAWPGCYNGVRCAWTQPHASAKGLVPMPALSGRNVMNSLGQGCVLESRQTRRKRIQNVHPGCDAAVWCGCVGGCVCIRRVCHAAWTHARCGIEVAAGTACCMKLPGWKRERGRMLKECQRRWNTNSREGGLMCAVAVEGGLTVKWGAEGFGNVGELARGAGRQARRHSSAHFEWGGDWNL